MLLEEVIGYLFAFLKEIVQFLPSMPRDNTQTDALVSGFLLLNQVLDVKWALANALLIFNMTFSVWMTKMAGQIAYLAWKAVKW